MPRTPALFPEKRKAILDAAQKVFAEHGFHGATNRLIAREAGITAGTIYWYFPSKEELFRAMIRERSVVPDIVAALEEKDRPPAEVLRAVAHAYLQAFDRPEVAGLFRVVITEGPRFPEVFEIVKQEILGKLIGSIATYITEGIMIGRFRQVDPFLTTVSFMSALAMQVIGKTILEGTGMDMPYLREGIVDTLVDAFVHGIERRSSPGGENSSSQSSPAGWSGPAGQPSGGKKISLDD